jgi:uncharacterized protein involved in cysteine biosynthesis
MDRPKYQPKTVEEELQILRQEQEYQGIAHRDITTARLAKTVAIVFGVLIVMHYAALISFVVAKGLPPIDLIQNAFHEWLPILTGFLGSAISYYFAGKKK